MAPKDAHVLMPRTHECVPLCGRKNAAMGRSEGLELGESPGGPMPSPGASAEGGRRVGVREETTEAEAGVMRFKDRKGRSSGTQEGILEAGKGGEHPPREPAEGPSPAHP